MSDLESRVRAVVLRAVGDRLALLSVPEADVVGDFDFVGSGVLDSIAFLELIVTLEQEFGFEVDLADMRIEEATTLKGLTDMVRSFAAPAND